MVTNGFAIWLVWQGELHPAVVQTLHDYGGMQVVAERDQALWFFFSTDAFLALARLAVWSKFNDLNLFSQLASAKLLFGYKRELAIAIDHYLEGQSAFVSKGFEIWIHPKAKEKAVGIPGLLFEPIRGQTGLAPAEWLTMAVDSRMPHQSSLGWFVVLKPLGSPLDKSFQVGWRAFFAQLEEILTRLKCKFIIHDFYLMFPINGLRQLRMWCRELLLLMARLKEEQPELYWPCVVAISDRKGLTFNNDLPNRMRLDWDQLVPGFPHMSYRNAYLLGDTFVVHDVRFSVDNSSVNDWCNISLSAEGDCSLGLVPVEIAGSLMAGSKPYCFYCGLRSHEPADCPSRMLPALDKGAWSDVALLDFEAINEGFRAIEVQVAANVVEAFDTLLQDAGGGGILTRAIFSINSASQIRMLHTMWLTRGADYPAGLENTGPKDDSPLWALMSMFFARDYVALDKELGDLTFKAPRDFRVRTLHGFVALERGDYARAMTLWKEAEGVASSPLLQAYHKFLQGRLMEVQGRYQSANDFFRQVARLTPAWTDAMYRQGVCQVKMGFAEQAVEFFSTLIDRDPHFFNRVLLDPELDRGHIQLLTALYIPWQDAESKAESEIAALQRLKEEIHEWFSGDHDYAQATMARIERLSALTKINNYVSFASLSRGRDKLERDLHVRVNLETRVLKGRFKGHKDRLSYIRDEAAWFPFPRVLVDFNKDYNLCAENLNWALQSQIGLPETFKKASIIAEVEEKRLERLEGKLRFLRIVRDSTLFVLILGKTFFWLELLCLLLVLVGVPLAIYYGERAGVDWLTGLLVREKWEVQKGLILILSIMALAIAALRTTLVFDNKRIQILKQKAKK